MTEPEDVEEDLFADLYDGDDAQAPAPSVSVNSVLSNQPPTHQDGTALQDEEPDTAYVHLPFDAVGSHQTNGNDAQNSSFGVGGSRGQDRDDVSMHNEPFGSGIKEDGKMFIGGLNWETTDQSLRDYFSQFGEVVEGTVMRDGATGRSRGFGFLTFRDPKTVNTVMVKEHFLDGKIIDPKRAIPRDEQEKTSKIFVGGVSQEASEQDFKEYFLQFGRVVDATLMMDKDTGRPRGFGFVTFDSEAAVENCLERQPLEILGKMIEVKKAQPRGKMNEEEDSRGGRGRGKFGRGGGDDRYNNSNNNNNNNNNDGGSHSQQGGQASQPNQSTMAGAGAGVGGGAPGMTPQMMAQYWQRMQQYFAMMQQQMAASAMQGGMGGMMNPQMMAQMQQMQAMQQMQKQMQQNQQQGSMSPAPQSPGAQNMATMAAGMQGMNPQMQQMMQMMQTQQQQGSGMSGSPAGAGPGGTAVGANRPGFNAQEQMAFEQQKYEQQQIARQQGFQHGNRQHHGGPGNFNQQPQQQTGAGPTSWEGMYDDVPQPNTGGRASAGGGVIRNLTPMNGKSAGTAKVPGATTTTPTLSQQQQQQSNAPANAPTGPKNAGRPGANFRGGRGGGGGGGGGRFHPYGR